MSPHEFRREFLATLSSIFVLAGCLDRDQTPDTFGSLTIAAEIYQEEGSQYVRIQVEHEQPQNSEFHNVTVLGYTRSGRRVFQREMGDSTGPPAAALEKWVTIECDKFPYIIAVTANESPCTEGLTFEVIRWNGTEAQKRASTPDNDPYPWEEFERQCGEELPPERLLPNE